MLTSRDSGAVPGACPSGYCVPRGGTLGVWGSRVGAGVTRGRAVSSISAGSQTCGPVTVFINRM